MENNKNILSWSIISLPDVSFSEDHPLYDSWMKKKKLQDEKDGRDSFLKSSSFYAEYSKIFCISACYMQEENIRLTYFVGEEKEIIDKFIKACESFIASKGSIISVGHGIMQHSIPYLRKRLSHYYPMFDFPIYLSDLGEKPWTMANKVHDLMLINAGVGEQYSSLIELAHINNIPYSKEVISGDEITLYLREERYEKVIDYSNQRVLLSLQIFNKWMGISHKEIINTKNLLENTVELLPLVKKAKGIKLTKKEEQGISKVMDSLEGEELYKAQQILEVVNKI